MNDQQDKELRKDLSIIAKEVTILSTMMKEVVVPGVKQSKLQWEENDKLNLPGVINSLETMVKDFNDSKIEQLSIRNDHEKLKVYVTDRFKVCFMLIFFLFSFYSNTLFMKMEKTFNITGLLGF